MSLLNELQRRKVIRVAGVYLVAAWLLIQIAATVAPILALPEWFEGLVLALLGLGFPVALILAWALEVSPDGIKSDSGEAGSPAGRAIDYTILAVVILGGAYLFISREDSTYDATPAPDASIAVLPFVNLSGDGDNVVLTSGIHSNLLSQLARIESLRTISRTSMLRYRDSDLSIPEIAGELGVATVLEGDVQSVAGSVRINVQLIDARSDEPMWNEIYDRELTAANVFAIQSEIARAIAEQLRIALSPDDHRRLDAVPTQSIDALQAYFIGKAMLERRNLQALNAAVDYFEAVVEFDPDFALGWSGLADAYMLLPEYSNTVDRNLVESRAREAVLRALELDPDIPEVRASEAWYQLRFFDWESAERIFRDALAAAPDNVNVIHWLSHVLAWRGDFEEAVELARRGAEIYPDSNLMRTNLAYILVDAKQYDEGLLVIRDIRLRAPGHMAARHNIFLHELRAGLPVNGKTTFIEFVTLIGGDPDAASKIGDMFIAYHEQGQVGRLTEDLIEAALIGSEDLAQVLAFVGDAEGTIAALQVAAAERSGSRSVFSMKINPAYDFIRDDPRFVALLEEVGLAD